MSIPLYAEIRTLEYDQMALSSHPIIPIDASVSDFVDLRGITCTGVSYPIGMTASILAIQLLKENVPTLGDVICGMQTAPGGWRTYTLKNATLFGDETHIEIQLEPSLMAGIRWLRVGSLNASGVPVMEGDTRQFLLSGRQLP